MEPLNPEIEEPVHKDAIKKKRRRVVMWTVIALAALTLITGNYGFYQIYKINREKRELEQEIARLKLEQEELIRDRERLKNDLIYIEKVAREKYSMVREGEHVYQVIPKKEEKKE